MIKIGAPFYINTLPFFFPFFQKKIAFDADYSFDVPSKINEALLKKEIDIGLISSAAFLENKSELVSLTSFGIGAVNAVLSVQLFTKKDVHDLHEKIIGVPKASHTSIVLLQVLCKFFWKIEPQFVEFDTLYPEEFDAFLLIGNSCLTEAQIGKPKGYMMVDLASEWKSYTGKPFIFALFACHRMTAAAEFEEKLQLALDYSFSHLDEIVAVAKEQTGLSDESLKTYFHTISYKLTREHFEGLQLFGSYIHKMAQE